MRVLVALQNGSGDAPVVAAVRRLVDEDDEVHVLIMVPRAAASETVSASRAPMRTFASGVATATGVFVPAETAYSVPAETTAQTMARVRSSALATYEREHARILPPRRIEVAFVTDEAEAVLAYAWEHRVHGIALGDSGRSVLRRWLAPSAAETVVRRATVPVLVVGADVTLPASGALARGTA